MPKYSLEEALIINKRAEIILKHYEKYRNERVLSFCTNRAYAEYIALIFREKAFLSTASEIFYLKDEYLCLNEKLEVFMDNVSFIK